MINVALQLYIFTGVGLLFYKFFAGGFKKLNWQKHIGESFFIGVFIVVLINNGIQLFSLEVSQRGLWYIILLVSTLSYASYGYVNKAKIVTNFSFKPGYNWLIILFYLLLVLKLFYIIEQNQNLPLTPWDAWNSWIAKAKIWYFHGINEVLMNRPQWLISENSFSNSTAHYPDALPLLYIFNSGFHGWNETALNSIYPAMFIALLLAFHGNIKILINEKYALAAVFVLLTIPFVNVHVSLAGYADIWVAAFLVLSLFNIQHFLTQPNIRVFTLASCFIFAMVMFKLISWVWVLMLVLVFILCLIGQQKRKWVYLLIAMVTVVWFMLGGIDLTLPFGHFVIAPDLIKIPALGSYKLSFTDTTSAWIEALFLSKNWNLLWFTVPITTYLYFRTKTKEALALPVIYLVFSSVFLFVLFYMTYNSVFANDFTSSNRVVLHIAPVYIYFVLQLFYQHQMQKATESSK